VERSAVLHLSSLVSGRPAAIRRPSGPGRAAVGPVRSPTGPERPRRVAPFGEHLTWSNTDRADLRTRTRLDRAAERRWTALGTPQALPLNPVPVNVEGAVVAVSIPPKHGTTTGYRRHGCRCDACRKAVVDSQRTWRQTMVPVPVTSHGVYGYNIRRCRCSVCRAAKAAYRAAGRGTQDQRGRVNDRIRHVEVGVAEPAVGTGCGCSATGVRNQRGVTDAVAPFRYVLLGLERARRQAAAPGSLCPLEVLAQCSADDLGDGDAFSGSTLCSLNPEGGLEAYRAGPHGRLTRRRAPRWPPRDRELPLP